MLEASRLGRAMLVVCLTACGPGAQPVVRDAASPDVAAPDVAAPDVAAPDGGPPDTTMRLVTVRDARARNAVCNNGEPFTYYLRRGWGAGADRWVIYLEGGGACGSVAECQSRWMNDRDRMVPARMPTRQGSGIQLADGARNPDFHAYNQVFLNYCSSDGWLGDRAASADTGGYHFRGASIVRAVLEDLRDAQVTAAPTVARAALVVFAGGSAGGEGQIGSLDRVASWLPGVRVVGVTDSYFHPNVVRFPGPPAPLDPATAPGTNLTFWNAQVDESCRAANATSPAVCMSGSFVYRYVDTPDFVFEDQLDENRLRELGVISGDLNPPVSCRGLPAATLAYVTPYTAAVRALFTNLRHAGGFSTAVGYHTALTHNDRFFTARVDGLTYAQTLGNWVFGRAGPKLAVAPAPCN